jgi:error-prone DNA polymerase
MVCSKKRGSWVKCHHPAAFFAAMLNCYPLGLYHPATLVKDAQRHGIAVLPIDVKRSAWNCTLEHGALRLGLKYIAGLREELGRRIEREGAARPFKSIADFAARVGPDRNELDRLAYAGAFAAFGHSRREALWQAAAVERDPQSLLAGVKPQLVSAPLPAMLPIEEACADYAATGLTAGPHLMTWLRPQLRARGVLSAADLAHACHGAWVKTAGVVIVRQRPATAKGFLFITLEDETGMANLIVTPARFQHYRLLLRSARIMLVEGVFQQVDGVMAIRAHRFAELTIDGALPAAHDFH